MVGSFLSPGRPICSALVFFGKKIKLFIVLDNISFVTCLKILKKINTPIHYPCLTKRKQHTLSTVVLSGAICFSECEQPELLESLHISNF